MNERPARTKTSSPAVALVTQRKRSPVKDPGGSVAARRMAAAILENWAGVRTPLQAASALSVSLPRYYQLEQRAVGAIVASCEPRPRGPGPNHERQIRSLERQLVTSRRDCARLEALLRTSQRTIGLPSPEPPASVPAGKKRRPRRPTARALKLARALASDSSGATAGEGIERPQDSAAGSATRVVTPADHGAKGEAP
jgi:hypothetical protein